MPKSIPIAGSYLNKITSSIRSRTCCYPLLVFSNKNIRITGVRTGRPFFNTCTTSLLSLGISFFPFRDMSAGSRSLHKQLSAVSLRSAHLNLATQKSIAIPSLRPDPSIHPTSVSTSRLAGISRQFSTSTLNMAPVTKQFDYIVIGGGSGGSGTARRASGWYGAKTAIIDAGVSGGTCVNVGYDSSSPQQDQSISMY